MAELADYDAVVLDIEGTITPLRFVYEVLLPYVQRELQGYVERHWNDPNVDSDTDELLEHLIESAPDDDDLSVSGLQDQSNVEAFRSEVIEHISWRRDDGQRPSDKLQRHLWRTLCEDGRLEAQVFDDVRPAMEHWQEAEIPVYTFSEGNTAAQEVLFEHSEAGDLREYVSAYFDTEVGRKNEPDSYRHIAEKIGRPPERVLYITDSLEEAQAAERAGLKVAIAARPKNPELDPHDLPTIESFGEVVG